MKNPYMTDENTVISFSGGRTSAYMLYKVLEAYDFKLPENIVVCFANTGKEMPETLDFVEACSDEWGVEIVWLERWASKTPKDSKFKYAYETKVTNYNDACRNGEPFKHLIRAKGIAPNPVSRFCTKELKIEAIRSFVKNLGWETPYQGFVGIRADETRRVKKIHNTRDCGQDRWCPLYLDGVTVTDVYNFWKQSSFDLALYNNKGTTDWGNCDLCFLKGESKKASIVRERPDLADWWIEIEDELALTSNGGSGSVFRTDHQSYKDMKIIATSHNSLEFRDDETIPCFCGG